MVQNLVHLRKTDGQAALVVAKKLQGQGTDI